ncbi:TrkA C-terminal domain-containing protein [Salegentibacter sp. JZCK2]|uniref:potassium channel family protein n=1 Tax=Salegentibacter tibetensis TaxID=2873600 RepID=UPI001CCE4CAB|nr:TrkA C-terminal domain-containing protein [Salegentibacter tibetensis]MBZ9728708.1 TrkA C-terminal domain-containing protein [Salegentibacter tibetensis]
MTAIISLLVIITLSILATRIGTIAFIHTGLSKEAAKFQARSAYMGVGFTTQESELVVNNPVRRKILTVLIFMGNAGIITTISSVIFSFISIEESGFFSTEIIVLFSGLLLLIALSRSKFIDRKLSFLIDKALSRYTYLEVKDYYNLLHLEENYRVSEIKVKKEDWLTNKTLEKLELDAEGVRVLGVRRLDGNYIGAPKGKTEIKEGDIIILYGKIESLQSLENRKEGSSGDLEHSNAVTEQKRREQKQEQED